MEFSQRYLTNIHSILTHNQPYLTRQQVFYVWGINITWGRHSGGDVQPCDIYGKGRLRQLAESETWRKEVYNP